MPGRQRERSARRSRQRPPRLTPSPNGGPGQIITVGLTAGRRAKLARPETATSSGAHAGSRAGRPHARRPLHHAAQTNNGIRRTSGAGQAARRSASKNGTATPVTDAGGDHVTMSLGRRLASSGAQQGLDAKVDSLDKDRWRPPESVGDDHCCSGSARSTVDGGGMQTE